MTDDLTALRDALKAADGPSHRLDLQLDKMTVGLVEAGFNVKPYTSSLDAALALKERVLPRWDVQLFIGADGSASAEIIKVLNEKVESVWIEHTHPAIALCIAVVEEVMKEQTDE